MFINAKEFLASLINGGKTITPGTIEDTRIIGITTTRPKLVKNKEENIANIS